MLKSKRFCKIRNGKAMNILVIYHAILQIADFVVVFFSESNRESEYAIDWPIHWLLPGMHYILFLCFIAVAVLLNSTFTHIGPIHALNTFEFLHFVIFWASIFYMSICAGVGCENLAPDLRDLASGYVAIPMGWSYLVMLFGAWINQDYECRFHSLLE